jgi:hypothetical protein
LTSRNAIFATIKKKILNRNNEIAERLLRSKVGGLKKKEIAGYEGLCGEK